MRQVFECQSQYWSRQSRMISSARERADLLFFRHRPSRLQAAWLTGTKPESPPAKTSRAIEEARRLREQAKAIRSDTRSLAERHRQAQVAASLVPSSESVTHASRARPAPAPRPHPARLACQGVAKSPQSVIPRLSIDYLSLSGLRCAHYGVAGSHRWAHAGALSNC